MQTLVFCLFGSGDGRDSLAKLNGILSLLTLSEELVDDLLLEEPPVEHALLFCHEIASLFFRFDRCLGDFARFGLVRLFFGDLGSHFCSLMDVFGQFLRSLHQTAQ